jgi:hypothetical protein
MPHRKTKTSSTYANTAENGMIIAGMTSMFKRYYNHRSHQVLPMTGHPFPHGKTAQLADQVVGKATGNDDRGAYALQTEYRGVTYRSQTEARWAVSSTTSACSHV